MKRPKATERQAAALGVLESPALPVSHSCLQESVLRGKPAWAPALCPVSATRATFQNTSNRRNFPLFPLLHSPALGPTQTCIKKACGGLSPLLQGLSGEEVPGFLPFTPRSAHIQVPTQRRFSPQCSFSPSNKQVSRRHGP